MEQHLLHQHANGMIKSEFTGQTLARPLHVEIAAAEQSFAGDHGDMGALIDHIHKHLVATGHARD